jgi:hypothetical protein
MKRHILIVLGTLLVAAVLAWPAHAVVNTATPGALNYVEESASIEKEVLSECVLVC